MKMSLTEITKQVGGQLTGADCNISSFSIDTRTLSEGDLYIALKGQNFDGHAFVEQAETAGAKALLVERQVQTRLSQVVVKDTHLALAELAGAWKKKAQVKTVGITGSNGKTTVKEMIAAILSVKGKVLYTQGNLNNDIGVPLTLLRLDESDQFAVIEMGANHAGEISYSCLYAKPDISVLTNVAAAHIEGFGSLQGVAKAKAEIIESLNDQGIAILNRDDVFYQEWKKTAADRKTISFGLSASADVRAEQVRGSFENKAFLTRFDLESNNECIDVNLRLAGQHNVVNALAAAASCLQMGANLQDIKTGLESIKPVTGRLQPLAGLHGGIIIDDTYNANPGSLSVALDVLSQCDGEPWVILGAFGEMGTESLKIHREMGELIKSMNVVRLLTIGSDAESTSDIFGKGATFFGSQQQLIANLKQELTGNETILVKGSRAQKMENVVAELVADFRK